ncbi:S-layer homology domain-containing protein [Proteocatella sphenisci]|uniref:S-layer homology domain-containing protein n=1 Tax=Proteocatella sphenisci TaxID=181070 RepID=UPI0004909B0B|nr:S-layer homology domain-containing protein [Proteocatella sphenisci]
MKKKILSTILTLCMIVTLIPIGVFADSEGIALNIEDGPIVIEDDTANSDKICILQAYDGSTNTDFSVVDSGLTTFNNVQDSSVDEDVDIPNSVVSVDSWSNLKTAVENAPTDGTLQTIEITGDFSKDGDGINIGDGKNIEDGKNIIIQSGAGGTYTITRANDEKRGFFGIYYEGNSLTLKNIVLDGNGENITATSTIIHKQAGSFIMESGAVIQNSRIDEGGNRAAAVSNGAGDFIMKPGSEIKNAENIEANGSGGVVNFGTFIMEGGSISGSKGALAGGVCNYDNVTIEGGTISGNTGKYAGGILNYGTLSVSGLINISDNINTDTGAPYNVYSSNIITVDTAGLDSGSRIGVTMDQSLYESQPVDITGNNSADNSVNFSSDDLNYTVKNSGTGENQVVQLTVPDPPDTESPFLTAGAAVRTGHTAGSVKFTSNESGSYYYEVVEAGAGEPYIDTEGDGESCTTSETTITDPAGLTAGAKDIYIRVKDAAGNVSSAIKIEIAAYKAPDTVSPFLTAGAAVRTGHTAVSVKFTSNESGSYYYEVVEAGAGEPYIETGGAGESCTTSETTMTDPAGLTAGAKDIYIKVKDAAGNVSSAIKIEIEAYKEPDTTAPSLTTGAVTRTSDTAGTVKFTSNEAGTYYYAIVADGSAAPAINTSGAGAVCTTAETTITNPTGLTAGAKDIYIKVKDAAGNVSTVVKIDITACVAPSSGSGSGSSSNGISKPTIGSGIVIVNGKEQNAGNETKTTESGKSTSTVEVDNKVIESKIDEAIKNNKTGTGNFIQVIVGDKTSDIAKVELTGDIVKKLEASKFNISVKQNNMEYIIPAEEFAISKVAKNLGVSETDLVDIKVEVKITKLDEKVIKEYKKVAEANGLDLILPPVSFEVVAKTIKSDGTTGEALISKFNNYVERVMEIPSGVDPGKITTGIVFNADGTYSHVPTSLYQKDGKWYASLNSLTNSNYSVIWNSVTVKSVENHWAKDVVNDMASRLVIFNPENFDPNKAITRADFAEYIVRALGLYREGPTHENKFKDVSSADERTRAILIANEYGIVAGYPDGRFRPDALITREEAMVMYQRVMKVTKLTGSDKDRYQSYTDFTKVNDWAKSSIKEVLAAHVFNGSSKTTISPKSNLTSAESVQAIKNILVQSKLINK